MTRTMYDAVIASNIPASAQMVAGYVDGRYAWSAADWARFPSAVKVRIAVFPWTNDGVVLDVETGDATPAQAPGWVRMRRAAGVDPSVYCSLSWWASVRAAFVAQGVPEPHYWVAAYPGIGAQVYPGSVAHQYGGPSGLYDLSAVADYWPGVDAVPVSNTTTVGGPVPTAPATLTPTPPEDDMDATQNQRLINVESAVGRLEAAWGSGKRQDGSGRDYIVDLTADRVATILPLVQQTAGDHVDSAAVAAAVLASLTPAAIAAAIPPTLATQVADELAKRLAQ